MKRGFFVALALALATTVVTWPGLAFEPTEAQTSAMTKNFAAHGKIVGSEHAPIATLEAKRLETNGSTMVSNFYNLGDGARWMLDELEKRPEQNGYKIISWYFHAGEPKVDLRVRWSGLQDQPEPPTKTVSPEDPLWEVAMEKSRLAWEILCEEYSCK